MTSAGDLASPNRRGTRRPGPSVPRRQLTDAHEIRAPSPTRCGWRSSRPLGREGPLTATEAGELLGESPANMSFHLRTLAKYGFVEEAPGGTGRQRPWRRVTVAARPRSRQRGGRGGDRRPDPLPPLRRAVPRAASAVGRDPHIVPEAWRDSSFAFDSLLYLTAEELDTVGLEFLAILDRYADRVPDRAEATGRACIRWPSSLTATPLPPSPSGN